MGTVKDMCTEPCIADLCRATCGLCPLTCYTCADELYPEECNKSSQCNSVHEYCVSIQELNSNLIPLFQSGCADVDRCLSIFGEINTKRTLQTRGYTLKGGCCDHNNCNYHDPSLRPIDPSPGTITRPVYPNGALNPDVCSERDIDTDFCTAIMKADPNICNSTCVANNLCAASCQTCRKCYSCQGVKNKDDCLIGATCRKNQACVTVQSLGANFELEYRLGCMNRTQCDQLFGTSISAPAVGRRKRQIQGSCCDSDYCQHALITTLPPPTTPTTTPMPTSTTAPSQSTMVSTDMSTGAASTESTTVTPTMKSTIVTSAMNATTVPAGTTLPPCKDYDKSGYCAKYVPLICNTGDALSKKFAIANCALSCNLCSEFYALVASGEIIISP
ncbi:uncharacterized protein [Argopecten irradians]